MWALRRASNPLKNQGFIFKTSQACVAKAEVENSYLDGNASNSDSSFVIADRCMSLKRFYVAHASPKFLMWRCSFSSQADTKDNAQEDYLEDGFSELEDPASANVFNNKNLDEPNEDELISEPELSKEEEDDGHDAGEPQDELEPPDSEANADEKKTPAVSFYQLVKAIIEAPPSSVLSALIKWVEEGNDLSLGVILTIMFNLRTRRMFGKALQISEWLMSTKRVDFVEEDYASHLSLISKVHGLHKAEAYFKEIPESFRGEVIYRTLLDSCVSANNVKKAEEVFNKMKDLNLPLTRFACNQLLFQYKRNVKKIEDVLLLMEKENWKPYAFAYEVLIDAKGQSNDIAGMDQNQAKPMFSSYVNVMEQYARRGDVMEQYAQRGDIHNLEKMFDRMRHVEYLARLRHYEILVQCYINAKAAPAYGIRERMKAESIFPDKALAAQLVLVDAFRKAAVSDLLD